MRFSIPISRTRLSGLNTTTTKTAAHATRRGLLTSSSSSSSSLTIRTNNPNANTTKYLTVNLRTKSTLTGSTVGTGEGGGETPPNPAHYLPSNTSPMYMPPPPSSSDVLSASPASSPSSSASSAPSSSSSFYPSDFSSDEQPPKPYEVHPLALDALLPTMNMHTQGHATDPYNQHPEDPQCQSVRKGLARRHFIDEEAAGGGGAFEGDLLAYSLGSASASSSSSGTARGTGGVVGLGNGLGMQEYTVVPEFASATMSSATLKTEEEREREKLRMLQGKMGAKREEDLIYESAGADYYGYPDPDGPLAAATPTTGSSQAQEGVVNPRDAEGYEGYMTRVYAATAGADAGAVVGDIDDPKEDNVPTKELDAQTREKNIKDWMERRKLALFYALDAARLSAEFPLSPNPPLPSSHSSSPSSATSSFSSSHTHPKPTFKSETSILSDWIEPLDQRGGNPEGIGMLDQVGSASGTWRFFRLGRRQGEGFVPGWVEPAK